MFITNSPHTRLERKGSNIKHYNLTSKNHYNVILGKYIKKLSNPVTTSKFYKSQKTFLNVKKIPSIYLTFMIKGSWFILKKKIKFSKQHSIKDFLSNYDISTNFLT